MEPLLVWAWTGAPISDTSIAAIRSSVPPSLPVTSFPLTPQVMLNAFVLCLRQLFWPSHLLQSPNDSYQIASAFSGRALLWSFQQRGPIYIPETASVTYLTVRTFSTCIVSG